MCLRPVRNRHLSGVHFTSHAAGADGRSTVLSWIDRPGSPALGQIGCGPRRCCAALSSVARRIPRILAGQPGDSVSERGKAAERETPVVYVLGIGVSALVSDSLRPPRRRPAPYSERDSNGPRGLGARHGYRIRTDPIVCRWAGGLLFVLSLGPELWWSDRLTGHSLPFATAHALVPGFSSLRIVLLFAAGMILPIALLAAIAVDRLTRSPWMAGWRKHAVAAALLALFALEFAHSPAKLGPTPDDRALQAALAESSDGAVAFVPSGAGFLTPDAFMRRMWWSLNGGRQAVISGYSGYTPRGTTYLARLVDWTDATNRRLVAESLVAFGVRSIVLDRKYLSEARTEDWQAVIQELRPAARVFDTGQFVVNHLGPDGVSSKTAWTDVEIQSVLRAALPDARIVVPVVLRNRAEVPWRPPPGRRTRSGELVWSRGDGTVDSRQSFRLHVPPLVPPNSTAQAMSLVHAQTRPRRVGIDWPLWLMASKSPWPK